MAGRKTRPVFGQAAEAPGLMVGGRTAEAVLIPVDPDREPIAATVRPTAADAIAPSRHYHGHRKRLSERFRTGGADALPDYELLELVLFAAHPRADMKPLAKALITKFGSFAEAVNAPEALRTRFLSGNASKTFSTPTDTL